MKSKLLILAIFFAAGSALAVAQQHEKNRPGNQDQKRLTPEQRVERMAQELSLTDAEKAKVLELFKKDEAKVAALRDEIKTQQANGQKDKAETATSAQEMRRAHDNELEKIIGKEKFLKMQTLRNQNMQKMKNNADKKGHKGQVNAKHKGQVNGKLAAQMHTNITPEIKANHMKAKLNLTDEQTSALVEVFKAQDLKNTEIRKQKMNEMMAANDAEIEKIIGKEKMVQFKETRGAQIDKMKNNRKAKK
ncbi:MAG: hypothetical protein KA206_01870 [Paludibacter sp.]|nr:hypothetical protein [Paludibacter sp.]